MLRNEFFFVPNLRASTEYEPSTASDSTGRIAGACHTDRWCQLWRERFQQPTGRIRGRRL